MVTIVAREKLSADALKTLKIGVSDTLILFKRTNKFLYILRRIAIICYLPTISYELN